MMYNYWFVIWGVCSSYLTVLSRYKEQLLTCYLVRYFSHLSLVVVYHGCNMLVLGVLLHLETSTSFELCRKLVRRARYQKKKREKKEGKALLSHKSQSHQNLKFGCSKDCVTSKWYRKANRKEYDQYQESSFCKAKKQKQQTNRKLFTRSTFCNINTQGGSKDVIQARQQRPESPAVTHLTCV